MTDELVLYVKQTCPWCVQAKAYLDKNGFSYREVDVQASSASFDELEKISGQRSVPTLVTGSNILADFGVDELVPFLKAWDIRPTKI